MHTIKLKSRDSLQRWEVREGETVVGYIEKYKNTRSEVHPHKAFLIHDFHADVNKMSLAQLKARTQLVGFVYSAGALARYGVSNDSIVFMTEQKPPTGMAPTYTGTLKTAVGLIVNAYKETNGNASSL